MQSDPLPLTSGTLKQLPEKFSARMRVLSAVTRKPSKNLQPPDDQTEHEIFFYEKKHGNGLINPAFLISLKQKAEKNASEALQQAKKAVKKRDKAKQDALKEAEAATKAIERAGLSLKKVDELSKNLKRYMQALNACIAMDRKEAEQTKTQNVKTVLKMICYKQERANTAITANLFWHIKEKISAKHH